SLEAGERRLSLTGLRGSARAWTLARLVRRGFGPVVCVTADEEKADDLAADLAFFLGEGAPDAPSVVRLPVDEVLPYDGLSPDRLLLQQRLAALFQLSQGVR